MRLIESANDPANIALLKRTGVQEGWACFEIGPGAGAILQWLGARVGARGLIIGINTNTTYFQKFSMPPYDVRTGHILDVPISHPLDLIHGRYVLIHNHQGLDILCKMYESSKPGSLAVFEEPDFTSTQLNRSYHEISQANVNATICRMFVECKLDPGYALILPQKCNTAVFKFLKPGARCICAKGILLWP